MYSQYSYAHGQYQQSVSTASTTVQQGSLTWNGSKWVKEPSPAVTHAGYGFSHPSSVPGSSSGSHQQHFQHAPNVLQPHQGESALDQYQRYWSYWTEQAKTHHTKASSLPPCPEKDEALRVAAWADYYANQSASAMQYYQTYPTAAASQHAIPPPAAPGPMTAPAPPPVAPTPAPPPAPKPSSTTVSTATPNGKKTAKDEYPPSLRRYMQKVLSKCSSEKERTVAQAAVAKEVQNAIMANALLTTDWDAKPLPGIVFSKSNNNNNPSSLQSLSSRHSQSNSSSTTVSSPSSLQSLSSKKSSTTAISFGIDSKSSKTLNPKAHSYNPSWSQSFDQEDVNNMPENDSYYGHSSSDNNDTASTQSDSWQPPNKKKKQSNSPIFMSKLKTAKTAVVVSKQTTSKYHSMNGFVKSTSALARRANRFSGTQEQEEKSSGDEKIGQYMGLSVIGGALKGVRLDENDYENMTVKGCCQKLEKEYLRLTQPPKPEMVRPQPILEKHLRNLKRKWTNGKCEYVWLCSQLKAIRQDLTIQRLFNDFAVEVYETHARIALEQVDLNEYNQCQTQLKELYDSLEKSGDDAKSVKGLQNRSEFIAYRIIYYVFLTGNKKYEGGSTDLLKIMLSLTPEQRNEPCIVHALKVRVAVTENDYHSFFRLHNSCPKMGAYLMDFMVPTIRMAALSRIVKAYRPNISVRYVLTELGFDVENKQDFDDGVNWLTSCGANLGDDGYIVTQKSSIQASAPKEKNSLI